MHMTRLYIDEFLMRNLIIHNLGFIDELMHITDSNWYCDSGFIICVPVEESEEDAEEQ